MPTVPSLALVPQHGYYRVFSTLASRCRYKPNGSQNTAIHCQMLPKELEKPQVRLHYLDGKKKKKEEV